MLKRGAMAGGRAVDLPPRIVLRHSNRNGGGKILSSAAGPQVSPAPTNASQYGSMAGSTVLCFPPGPMAAKPIFQNIAILGVGLIGSSIGAAVADRRLASEIVGIDRDPKILRAARQQGAICRGTTQLERGVSEADLVLVCTPIETIVDRVAAVAAATEKPCLITDVGSTKARIVAAVGRNTAAVDRFVGSHPMAGNEQQGPRHADKNLFLGRSVILTPIRNTNRTAFATA